MTYKTKENLIAALESFALDGSFAAANRAIGASSNSTIWQWVAQAKKAKEQNDKSFWWLTWREVDGWWTDFCLRARSEQCLMADGILRSQNALGVSPNPVRDPATGYRLQARDMANWYKTDEQLSDEFLLPRDRYLWDIDPLTGGRTIPVWEMGEPTQLPASLRAKVMTSTVPGWQEKTETTLNINPVSVVIAPAPWQPKTQRVESAPIVDAEFKELPAPKTVDELRAERRAILLKQAEEHLARTDRVTRPNGPTAPYTGSGRPAPDDPQERAGERDANGKGNEPAAPYSAPRAPAAFPQAPLGPTPSYVRRRPGQPLQGMRPDGSREPVRVIKR